MGRMDRIGKTATSIRTEDGWTYVKYHDTDVVGFNSQSIVLYTGGWQTATTKARMNQASYVYDLGYSVDQIDGLWWITAKDQSGITASIPFYTENEVILSRGEDGKAVLA